MTEPRYPVYIPSKGRAEICTTPVFLHDADVPFYLVVEPQDYDAYVNRFGKEWVIVMEKNDQGIAYARNAIKDYAKSEGHSRHWQIDDDLRTILRMHRGKRIKYPANLALAAVEDFCDQYENIAIAGLRSRAFGGGIKAPFSVNRNVYGCILVFSETPFRWRITNEDTDMSLQVLSSQWWCTILVNMFLFEGGYDLKTGGNSDNTYKDSSFKMNREFERMWRDFHIDPHKRIEPQINHVWRRFEQRPIRRKNAPKIDPKKYQAKLVKVKEPESERIRKIYEEGKDG